MTTSIADMDILKEIPGYKAIMKAVLKTQIQLLVEQLCDHTGEESIILTASVNDGSLSHLGSDLGKGFLDGREEIKSQFLGYCLKGHHKKKTQEAEQPYQRSNISQPSPRTPMQQQAAKRPRPHPTSMTKSPQFSQYTGSESSFAPPAAKRSVHERTISQEQVSDNFQNIQQDTLVSSIVKQEGQQSDNQKDNDLSGGGSFTSQQLPASLQLSHTQTSGETSQIGDSSNIDTETTQSESSIKLEPVGDDEDLEITGIEMGEGVPANWGQDGSGAMDYGSEGGGAGLSDQSANQAGYGLYPVYLSQSYSQPPNRSKMGRPPMFRPKRQGIGGSSQIPKGYKQCEICKKILRTVSMFQHKKMHRRSGNTAPTQVETTPVNATPRGYKECEICGKVLKKVSMFQHRRMHIKYASGLAQPASTTPESKIPRDYKECETCGKVLKKMSMFQHRQMHLGIKKYECDYCGKKFTQKATLNVHRRIHTGEKPYNCFYCGKAFSSNSGVLQHSRRCGGVVYSDYDQQ